MLAERATRPVVGLALRARLRRFKNRSRDFCRRAFFPGASSEAARERRGLAWVGESSRVRTTANGRPDPER